MKRCHLPASALVLVPTACGAGAKPALQAARLSTGRRLDAIAPRQAAESEAQRLVDSVVPARGAKPLARPPAGLRWPLRDARVGIPGDSVDRRRFWRSTVSVASVESLRPRGWGSPWTTSTGGGDDGDRSTDLTFAVRGFGGRSTGRL